MNPSGSLFHLRGVFFLFFFFLAEGHLQSRAAGFLQMHAPLPARKQHTDQEEVVRALFEVDLFPGRTKRSSFLYKKNMTFPSE